MQHVASVRRQSNTPGAYKGRLKKERLLNSVWVSVFEATCLARRHRYPSHPFRRASSILSCARARIQDMGAAAELRLVANRSHGWELCICDRRLRYGET